MQIDKISQAKYDEWNAFVTEQPYFSLLQSWQWGEFKEKMGWKVYRIVVKNQNHITASAQLLIKSFFGGFTCVAYVPRGPICDWSDQETTSCLLNELHRITRLHRAALLTIEPPILSSENRVQQIQQYGFRPSRYSNQPRSSIIVDISPSEDEILLRMRKKTRQYIHSAIREGITVRIGTKEDLPAFYNLMRSTGQREHFPTRSREYYEHEWQILSTSKQCILLMAYSDDQLLAVRTAYCFGKHAAEFHAGSISQTSILHPNYLLVWEAILWAKAQGSSTYDLWGIPDEIDRLRTEGHELPVLDRTDGLWGVYRFKSGFSKNIVSYVGAYDYVYQPWIYAFIDNHLVRGETLDRIITKIDSIKSNPFIP